MADAGVPVEWDEPGPPPRGILVPILIALCVVLLVAFVGVGIWLANRDRAETPAPISTTSTPTSAVTTTTPPTASPTTPAPSISTEPSPSGPMVVTVPDLGGADYETAAAKLTELALNPIRVDQPDEFIPAGTVIGTVPAVGTAVVPGFTVRILVSTGPAPVPSPSAPSPTVSPS